LIEETGLMRKTAAATRLAGFCLTLAVAAVAARAGGDEVAKGFGAPPDSAKPHTWWHWMNGNVTKEGITADLEAMKRVGVGGAQIFVVDSGIPAGDVKFMGPKFREMFKFAVQEADRVGIELCVHNCAGWSSSGGPWNTPEHAMQFVVTSETQVKGPAKFEDPLPQPPTKLGYYRDIAVLAFRTPGGSAVDLKKLEPKVGGSFSVADGAALYDGKVGTVVEVPAPVPAAPSAAATLTAKPKAAATRPVAQWVELTFAEPVAARSIVLTPGEKAQDCAGSIEVSEDGTKFRRAAAFRFPRSGSQPVAVSLGGEPVSARVYRVQFNSRGHNDKTIPLAEVSLASRAIIPNLQNKAGYEPGEVNGQDAPPVAADQVIAGKEIVDLTGKLGADGALSWDVPEGEWTVLRFGHTPTGKENHPAPPEAAGPECDKLSKAALDAHWAGMMGKLLDDLGPLAGKALNNALVDSYEVGGQNWTPLMREEFQKRRGYDMTRFLPVMAGMVVDGPEASERFLWDLRRTVADLFAENYYGHFAELCHRAGLKASIEPYTGPFESLQCGEPADIVMGEFWTGSQGHPSVKLAASVAHIYGKSIVGAESFTASPGKYGRWQEDPYALKALGDLMYTQGINRYIFHRYAMQPWTNRLPGMTMGQWGFHFDRTNTWFEQSTAWLEYIARCQYLLQQGRMVADVAYFCGESAPVEAKVGQTPKGYDYDAVNAGVLKKATVKDGRIVLASGASYAVLVLPPNDTLMTPGFLGDLKRLVADGATVVGPKPVRSPSLQGYPACDEEVKKLADELWGTGKVTAGTALEQAFAGKGLKPDFEYTAASPRARLVYIHRAIGGAGGTDGADGADGADVYFVSNQQDVYQQAECTFRVGGRVPELWHADTGVIEDAPAYKEDGGRVTVPVQLEPSGSVFVVFRRPSGGGAAHLVSFPPATSQQGEAPKLEIRKATYEAIDGAGSMDVTKKLAEMVKDGALVAEANNRTFGKDPAGQHHKQLRIEYALGGKVSEATFPENAMVELPATTGVPPAYEVSTGEGGKVQVVAWKAGTYEFARSSGQPARVAVESVAAPVEVTGPWEVRFPEGWKAPAKVTFETLASWTEQKDEGIKYFSGTATYAKRLDVPGELIAAGKVVYLDLGRVKNIAQVKVNGKDLGILWKPPFRVNVTDVVKAGENEVEIRVTNLWPNRLIGDERLPEDVKWDGKKLAGWPEFILKNEPSPSGRLTFTTWHHWTKDMDLLESGLIGPVVLKQGRRVPVE
jgi:hypothetical protein